MSSNQIDSAPKGYSLNSFTESHNFFPQSDNQEDSTPSESPSTFISTTSEKKPQSHFPIKSIYQPELFLEQEGIDQYLCGLCFQICDEPVITGCGCPPIYCKKCLELHYSKNHVCPKCKKETGEPTRVDIIVNAIKNKLMKCINYNIQCTWEGKCKDYLNHIQYECPKEVVNCPNKGCIIKLRREEVPEHLKKCEFVEYICDKCSTRMPIREKMLHKNICLKEIIPCPQGCKLEIERGDFNLHRQHCQCSIIECPYTNLGCTDKFKRKQEKEKLKEDLNKHLLLSAEKILNLEKISQEYFSRIKILESEVQSLKESKKKNEEELKTLSHLKNKVINLESEIKELKKYKEEQINKEQKHKLDMENDEGNGKIKLSHLNNFEISFLSKEKNKDLEIENGVKNKKEKKRR